MHNNLNSNDILGAVTFIFVGTWLLVNITIYLIARVRVYGLKPEKIPSSHIWIVAVVMGVAIVNDNILWLSLYAGICFVVYLIIRLFSGRNVPKEQLEKTSKNHILIVINMAAIAFICIFLLANLYLAIGLIVIFCIVYASAHIFPCKKVPLIHKKEVHIIYKLIMATGLLAWIIMLFYAKHEIRYIFITSLFGYVLGNVLMYFAIYRNMGIRALVVLNILAMFGATVFVSVSTIKERVYQNNVKQEVPRLEKKVREYINDKRDIPRLETIYRDKDYAAEAIVRSCLGDKDKLSVNELIKLLNFLKYNNQTIRESSILHWISKDKYNLEDYVASEDGIKFLILYFQYVRNDINKRDIKLALKVKDEVLRDRLLMSIISHREASYINSGSTKLEGLEYYFDMALTLNELKSKKYLKLLDKSVSNQINMRNPRYSDTSDYIEIKNSRKYDEKLLRVYELNNTISSAIPKYLASHLRKEKELLKKRDLNIYKQDNNSSKKINIYKELFYGNNSKKYTLCHGDDGRNVFFQFATDKSNKTIEKVFDKNKTYTIVDKPYKHKKPKGELKILDGDDYFFNIEQYWCSGRYIVRPGYKMK